MTDKPKVNGSFPNPFEAASSIAASTNHPIAPPPELEQTLSHLASHRSVLGYLLIMRDGPPFRIIRRSGVIFEGEQGRKYAATVAKIVETVSEGLASIPSERTDADDPKFMRIRTRRHELMITPDKRYLLAVLHDPNSS